ncbi:MAG: aminotransferase class I/II-fold pyridoxal phosphate-dependent enzyme [Planctomycetia bacterium]|nr:aminotransferase class I/II-fold pyridoxal phosphate-dependent enzyme [Planctomycetia bacterium]
MPHIDHLPGSFFGPPTLVDLLRHRATHQPNDLAFGYLLDGDSNMRELSNFELDRGARAIAAWLESKGLAGQRAMLLYPPGLDFIIAYFGCLYAGVIAVPVYPPKKNRSVNRIQIIARDCSAKVALTNGDVLSRVGEPLEEAPSLKALLWLNTDEIQPGTEEGWFMPDIHGETEAFLQYTSGSTGNPKGVILNHSNLLHNSALISHAFENTRSGVGVFWLPNYHDMGLIGGVLQPLYVGRPNILMSPMAFLQRPFRWLSAITRYRATTSGGPNFAYELCVNKIKPEQVRMLDLSTWKVAFNGAEPVRPETLNAFAEKFAPAGFKPEAFYPCYGLAEATLIVSGGFVPKRPTELCFDADLLKNGWAVEVEPGSPKARRIVGNGGCMPDQVVAIVNPDTEEVCVEGEVGEIWINGPSVAQGYWEKPEVTKKAFHASIKNFRPSRPVVSEPYFRTGDLGFVWKGELYVSGRLKDMIIWHGVNLYPQDIELTAQNAHSLCRADNGAFFAVEKDGKELLVLVQEVDRAREPNYPEVIDAIRRAISQEHELPIDAIYLIKHGMIPKTSSGKIQRHAARNEFLEGSFNPVARWDAADGRVVLEEEIEQIGMLEESKAILYAGVGSSVPQQEKFSADEHISDSLRAQIPDLASRGLAILQPKSLDLPNEPLVERNPAPAAGFLHSTATQNATQAPMIGATTIDDTDEDDSPVALDNDGAGFDPELEKILAARSQNVGIDMKDIQKAIKTLNTSGLPEDLATPELLSKMLKIILQQVRLVAKERAVGIVMDTPITELGMDSLERMEILNALEETFGGRFPEMVLQDLITAKDVAEAICKYFGKSPTLRDVLTHTESAKFEGVRTIMENVPEEYYVFEKSPEFIQLQKNFEIQLQSGLRNPYFTTHEGQAKDTTIIGGKEYIHFSSYNYLGLGAHPDVLQFVKEMVDKYGTSASASRLVSGQKDIHLRFEEEMAEFYGTEDAIVFSAGHHVNESVLGHLCGKGDLILHDALAHNSIVMGALLSGAQRRPFHHNDWEMANDILKRSRSEFRRVWIAIEGVYSMDGDVAPVPEFIEMKKRNKAYLYVDEAHSLGTLGKRGAGVCDHFGISPSDGDLWMGTISKSFGSCGGFISGKKSIIEYLRYTTPGFVFSAAIAPPATAAALGALRVLKREPERVERLRENSALFLRLAKEGGLNTGLSAGTPVIPIIYGNSLVSMIVAQRLFEKGINVQPIMYPAVEEKAARLRFFMTAIHTREQIEYTAKTLIEETKKVLKELSINSEGGA